MEAPKFRRAVAAENLALSGVTADSFAGLFRDVQSSLPGLRKGVWPLMEYIGEDEDDETDYS